MKRLWAKIQTLFHDEACPLCFRYIGQKIERDLYYHAWRKVGETEAGKALIMSLQQELSSIMLEVCPGKNAQERSDWVIGHDARLKVVLDLVSHATRNTDLIPRQAAKLPPIRQRVKQGDLN